MYEIIFLLALGIVWILFASIQDLKTREVANWLSFSLVIFALAFRLFYSINLRDMNFLYQGFLGLGIFFIIGNLMYYGRVFAGGDAKLMIVLGSILPLSENIFINLKMFVLFFILFLFSGAIYGFIFSVFLSLKNFKNFKKEFIKKFILYKKFIYLVMFFGLILMFFGFYESLFFILGIFLFLFPYVYVYAKAIDESAMIRFVNVNNLTEGDWLYKDLILIKNKKKGLKNKLIKSTWEGLNKNQIKEIREVFKNKKIKIRQGIAFVPVFLISFLIFAFVIYEGYLGILWNSFW